MLADFLVVRESAGLQLGKNQLPVDADFKSAAIGWNEDESLDPCFELRNEPFGQTDRLWFVVSGLAVDDFDFHDSLCLCRDQFSGLAKNAFLLRVTGARYCFFYREPFHPIDFAVVQ